ncbi:Uncharacterised protein [Stenotrophomonas maltophilia]|nr:Uncharacterised protein [Stenotrophomonas maltophilia]
MASGGGAIGLAEAAEQMVEELRCDAITGIAHRDHPVVAVGLQLHVDAAFGRGELDCVRQQVPEHLLQAGGIAQHQAGLLRQQQTHVQRLAFGDQFLRTDGFAQQVAQVQYLHLQLHLAQQHAAEVEHVRDQPLLRTGAVGDHIQALVQRAGVVHALQQQLAPTEDGGQRRAQLVRQRGQELVLQPRHVLGGTARGTLGLQKLFAGQLDLAAFGHVRAAAGQADEAAHPRETRACVHLQPTPLAIGASGPHQRVHRPLRLQCFLQFVLEHRCIVRMHQAAPDIFRHACFVTAKELTESAVDETGMAALVEHPHRHRQAVGQCAEAGFAFAQLHFHLLACGDVEEQDADLVFARTAHAHRINRERAAQRTRFHLELGGAATARDLAVDAEPVLLVARFQRRHALATRVLQAGVALERIVDLDETVVHRAIALEQHLDHAETGVDALKHAMMQVGFGRWHHHRWALHEGRQCGQGASVQAGLEAQHLPKRVFTASSAVSHG